MNRIQFAGVSLLALTVAAPTFAQAPQQAAEDTSDDIIVTATKREQTLQDVPISVSVTGQETVEKAQIRDLIDLQSVVPSLIVTQLNSTSQTNFTIRGFGNGNGNDGIESSVGVFIDGVYRSRSAAALDDLPEIERIEVLRGPQSTLFGKNVSAGAISIVTKKPQFTFGGKAEVSLGNYGSIQSKGSFTGPITDTVAVRLSGSVNERDGFFTNSVTGRRVADRNRWSVRGDILWQPTSDLSVRIIGDYNYINEVCCGVTSILNGPATLAIGAPPPAGLGRAIANTSNIFARNLIFNSDPTNRLRGKGVSGQIDYSFGFAKLTSITAYRNQTSGFAQDVDFTGADIATNTLSNNIDTFTQEFRLASEGNGPFTWLIGGFYEDEKLFTGRDIRFGNDARAYLDKLTGGALALVEGLQAASGNPGQKYFAAGQGIADNYNLKQRSYSLFGQAEYKITPRLTITGGVAYLNDRKAETSNVVLNDQFSLLNLENIPNFAFLPFAALPASVSGCLLQKGYNPAANGGKVPVNLFGASLGASLPGPGSAPCPASRAGTNPFGLNAVQFYYGDTTNHAPVNIPNANESGIFTGDKITYAGRIAYDFGFLNVYASYTTGWKADAVNLSSDSRPPSAANRGRFAGPENVKVYEFGAKAKFRGGFLNLAVFKQTIEGFQVNSFTGTGYNLVNAGQESIRGFEIDAAYRPFPFLSLTGAATYLDPRYDSFQKAACFSFDTVRCPVDPTTGRIPLFRDLTGDRPSGIPEWSASASATLNHSFTPQLSAYLRGEFDYVSNTRLTDTVPSNISTYGTSAINASVGAVDSEAQLEVQFWVRNLTKDNALVGAFATVVQDGSYSGYPNNPRTYGMTLRKTF